MPLIQGGPPQWAWERTADSLKWEIAAQQDPRGHTVYELRLNCGLEIVRLQVFTEDEIKALESVISEELSSRVPVRQGRQEPGMALEPRDSAGP